MLRARGRGNPIQRTPPGAAPTVRTGHALSILRKQADGRWVAVRDANLLTVKS